MDHTEPPPPDSHTPPPPPVVHERPPETADHQSTPLETHTEQPKPAPAEHNIKHPVRLLLVIVVVFVGLFLVLRTLAVEPFGVPTGSMAPALIGHHRTGPCPRCGYTVRVGRPSSGNLTDHFTDVVCPNCDQHFSLADAPDLSGDRLLVDKNVYSLRSPRRWEMVVFRCPDPDPKEFGKPYVKRLIGLPGETVSIVDGDVYVNGQIVRKGLAEVRETMFPVFDMAHPPKVTGWGVRWLVAPDPDPRLPARATGHSIAASAPEIQDNALVLDATESPQAMAAVTYRHWHLDERKVDAVRVWNAYDGSPRHFGQLPAAHDFILTCDVEAAGNATSEACFACRLFDGADAVTAEITVGPRADGRAHLTWENNGGLAAADGVALRPGRTHRLEFAFVDRRAMLALDGKLVVAPADLPQVTNRKDVPHPLQLGARGCRVTVRNLKLSRDIHYTQYGEHGTRRPLTLGAKEYYVLGDNSGNSQDSRKWPSPAVPEADFIGKPFLIHQPLRLTRISAGGRERVFQTLDWSRLRWLH